MDKANEVPDQLYILVAKGFARDAAKEARPKSAALCDMREEEVHLRAR